MSQQTTKIRIHVSEDKLSIKSRVDRAGVVAKLTPQSALFQAETALQQSGAKLVVAGAELAAADNAVIAAEAQLATARKTRETKQASFDSAYSLYVGNAEHFAESPEAASGLGLLVADKGSHPLAPPTDVQASFQAEKEAVVIRVKHAPGMHACVVEMRPDSAGPSSWNRLDGIGARHVVTGITPGTYWVRAAGARANQHSAFTPPVAVVVK